MGQSVKDSFGVNMSGVTVDALGSDSALREHLYMACLAELTNRGSHAVLEDTPDAVFKCAVELFGVGEAHAGGADSVEVVPLGLDAAWDRIESDARFANDGVSYKYLFWFLRYVGKRFGIESLPNFVTADWLYSVVSPIWGRGQKHCIRLFTNLDTYRRDSQVKSGPHCGPDFHVYDDAYAEEILSFLISHHFTGVYCVSSVWPAFHTIPCGRERLNGDTHLIKFDVSGVERCKLHLGLFPRELSRLYWCWGLNRGAFLGLDDSKRPLEGDLYYLCTEYMRGLVDINEVYSGEFFNCLGALVSVVYNLRFVLVGDTFDAEVYDYLDSITDSNFFHEFAYVHTDFGFVDVGEPTCVLCVEEGARIAVDGGRMALESHLVDKGWKTFLRDGDVFEYVQSDLQRDIKAELKLEGGHFVGFAEDVMLNLERSSMFALCRRVYPGDLIREFPNGIKMHVKRNIRGLPFIVYIDDVGVYYVVEDYFMAVDPVRFEVGNCPGDPSNCDDTMASSISDSSLDCCNEAYRSQLTTLDLKSLVSTFRHSDSHICEMKCVFVEVDGLMFNAYIHRRKFEDGRAIEKLPYVLTFKSYIHWDDEFTFTGDMSVFDKYLS